MKNVKKLKLGSMDQMIWKLYTTGNAKESVRYTIETEAIHDKNTTRLSIQTPITKWTKDGKERKELKQVFQISDSGDIEFLSQKEIDENEKESTDDFLNKTIYIVESCNEDLIRITKGQTLIQFEDNQAIESIKTSIIYINPKDEKVIDKISLGKEPKEKAKILTTRL